VPRFLAGVRDWAVPKPTYSFVIPVRDEAECLPELTRRLGSVIDQLDGEAEIIFVDDGSTDDSFRILCDLRATDERVKVIRLARNFGHQAAITAGFDIARGEATVVMDADLQDPPELVAALVERWREGFDVVYAVRRRREGDPVHRRLATGIFYRTLRHLTAVDIPAEAGDFRLVDRRVLDEFKQLRERNRYIRGMFAWLGFRQTGVAYERDRRYAGSTGYRLRDLTKFALDAVVGFSEVPLRFMLLIGFSVAAISFAIGVWALVAKLAGSSVVPGWASVMIVVSFLGGVQLAVVGVLGLYVARIYDEVRGRPLYVVAETCGLDSPVSNDGEH
jgi:polyisoprenyl-phosphate glycosyltransferase